MIQTPFQFARLIREFDFCSREPPSRVVFFIISQTKLITKYFEANCVIKFIWEEIPRSCSGIREFNFVELPVGRVSNMEAMDCDLLCVWKCRWPAVRIHPSCCANLQLFCQVKMRICYLCKESFDANPFLQDVIDLNPSMRWCRQPYVISNNYMMPCFIVASRLGCVCLAINSAPSLFLFN
jgi:hypothetical protein